MHQLRIYVAGPYTLGIPEENVRTAITAGEAIFSLGCLPYIPHLNHSWHLCYPHSHAEWLAMDLEWLRLCQAVYRLPGLSQGADEEVAIARTLGLPVFTTMEDLAQWPCLCNAGGRILAEGNGDAPPHN